MRSLIELVGGVPLLLLVGHYLLLHHLFLSWKLESVAARLLKILSRERKSVLGRIHVLESKVAAGLVDNIQIAHLSILIVAHAVLETIVGQLLRLEVRPAAA